ncbi:hypothetical protein SeMB42_g06344 [Synchytrium endobioticum]|uniref:Uncharacterized protein n=1 Tax=Synchytrium endobioticum TaxID=286115 RepID=A0A507CWY4_9FUNG|nr:hypothetical protein SeMB42_g06344 [Synchytrium endobioticum]TPX43653.1 hypothetical protein SeLEV6574_g04930 [Synchytrium endobioticum]
MAPAISMMRLVLLVTLAVVSALPAPPMESQQHIKETISHPIIVESEKTPAKANIPQFRLMSLDIRKKAHFVCFQQWLANLARWTEQEHLNLINLLAVQESREQKTKLVSYFDCFYTFVDETFDTGFKIFPTREQLGHEIDEQTYNEMRDILYNYVQRRLHARICIADVVLRQPELAPDVQLVQSHVDHLKDISKTLCRLRMVLSPNEILQLSLPYEWAGGFISTLPRHPLHTWRAPTSFFNPQRNEQWVNEWTLAIVNKYMDPNDWSGSSTFFGAEPFPGPGLRIPDAPLAGSSGVSFDAVYKQHSFPGVGFQTGSGAELLEVCPLLSHRAWP